MRHLSDGGSRPAAIGRWRLRGILSCLATTVLVLFAAARATGAVPTPAADPVVATVAGVTIRAATVWQLVDDAPTAGDALKEAIVLVAVAGEARLQLGEDVAGLSHKAAAERLLRRLFDPGKRCARLPEPAKRQHYAETAWRFMAPAAYTVVDLQVLCCSHPKRCHTAEATECRVTTLAGAQALREELGTTATAAALRKRFAAERETNPRLGIKRYTFYYDPAGNRMNSRLQEVDHEVAEAVAALQPGETSGLVTTRFGHHILFLESSRPPIALAYADTRTQAILTTELCPGHLITQRQRFLEDLLKHLPVTLAPDAEAAVERARPPT